METYHCPDFFQTDSQYTQVYIVFSRQETHITGSTETNISIEIHFQLDRKNDTCTVDSMQICWFNTSLWSVGWIKNLAFDYTVNFLASKTSERLLYKAQRQQMHHYIEPVDPKTKPVYHTTYRTTRCPQNKFPNSKNLQVVYVLCGASSRLVALSAW